MFTCPEFWWSLGTLGIALDSKNINQFRNTGKTKMNSLKLALDNHLVVFVHALKSI